MSTNSIDLNDAASSGVLTEKPLARRLAISPGVLLGLTTLCVLFLYYHYIPIYYTDFWGHVAYGDWILRHRQLPEHDMFAPLAEGVPILATAWLSQVAFALAGRWLGTEGYSLLFGLTVLATYGLLMRVFWLQTRRWSVSVACVALTLFVMFTRHTIIRPEIFGSLCFAGLLWLVVKADPDRTRHPAETPRRTHPRWLSVGGTFLIAALWANLHGSYVMGIALLGCCWLGRWMTVLWETWSLKALWRDSQLWTWFLMGEAAVLGTLCNPYGIDLTLYTLMFSSHPNLNDIVEWYVLKANAIEAICVACSWVLLVALFRHSRARIAASDVLLLGVFTLAVCARVRMVTWYAPVVAYVLAPHLRDVGDRLTRRFHGRNWWTVLTARNPRWTMIAGLFLWMTFAFSPTGSMLLGGKPRAERQVYARQTPRGISDFLKKNPPRGLIANPQWWGDWLTWQGPENLQVLMTTNAVHATPPRVWKDYMSIANGARDYESRLDRYRINTIVVDSERQQELARLIEKNAKWKVVYRDDIGFVATRLPKSAALGN